MNGDVADRAEAAQAEEYVLAVARELPSAMARLVLARGRTAWAEIVQLGEDDRTETFIPVNATLYSVQGSRDIGDFDIAFIQGERWVRAPEPTDPDV